jgi:hypothetical protein
MRQAPALPPQAPAPGPRTFSLATLMLVVTFTCVWLGVTVQWPPVGIVLAIFAIPALVRASWYRRAWRKAGEPMTSLQSAASFLGSLLVVTLIAGAALAALATAAHVAVLASCSPLDDTAFGSGVLIIWVFVLAPALALFVGGLVLWRLWISQVRQRRTSGRPLTASERVHAFWHALLVTASTLAAAAAGGLSLLWALRTTKIDYAYAQQAQVVWPIVWLLGLAGFLTAGWYGYRFSRRDVGTAWRTAVCCLGVWIGLGFGWNYWPQRYPEQPIGLGQFFLLVITLLYLLPIVGGAAALVLFHIVARAISRNGKPPQGRSGIGRSS